MEKDLLAEIVKRNDLRLKGNFDYSVKNGQIEIVDTSLDNVTPSLAITPDDLGEAVSTIGGAISKGVDATVEGAKGLVKGIPRGLGNFAVEFNKTFLPGFEENVVPFLQENIPGLKKLNSFVSDIVDYKNTAQEVGGGFLGEPLGEFGVTGGALSSVARSAGVTNRFISNVLGFGTAEAIAVPAEEQGLLAMGIDMLAPDNAITKAILEGLASDEDASIFMQKLQKAPENIFAGGLIGEGLDKAVRSVGTLYKYIKNSPRLDSIKEELKGGISTLGDTAREFLDKNRGGTTLGTTDIPKIIAEGTKALDEVVNPKKIDDIPEIDPYIKDTIESVEPDYKNKIKEIALTRNPEVKDKENPKILTEDLHKFYDNLAIKKHGRKLNIENPDDYNTVKAELVQSIQQQVKKEVSGKGWYDADVLKTFNLLSRTPGFERLGEDETHRVILSAILGATSPGPKVAQNTKAGLAQYLQFARSGKFSTEAIKPGSKVQGIQSPGFGQYGYPEGLRMLQFLLDKFGEEGFADFMLSPKTKGELTKLRLEAGFKSGPAGMSGTADSLHLGMLILGDKAGKFALNINGYPSTTKDRWFVRTIRRSEGTFGDNLVKKVDKKKGTEKMVELGQPRNQSERLLMDQLVKDIIADPALADLNLTEQDAQAILWFREQTLQNDLGVPTYPETFSEGVGKINEQEGFGILASDEDKVAIEQGTVSPEGFRGISARQRTVRDNRRLQLLNNPEGDGGSSGPYTRESETDDGRSGLLTFQPNPEVLSRYNTAGLNIPVVNQVDPKTSANSFSSDMASAMVDHPYGKQVTIQDPDNLLDAKLYRTEFGGGFAIKPDGDIIGVFQGANAPPKTSYAMIQLAVEQGGKKLDAFNTMLPRIYETLGFRPVSRVKWDDTQAPDGWNKETFAEYNNGEPDLVFFVYDPNYFGGVKIDELPIFTDYDEAQKIQTKALADLEENK